MELAVLVTFKDLVRFLAVVKRIIFEEVLAVVKHIPEDDVFTVVERKLSVAIVAECSLSVFLRHLVQLSVLLNPVVGLAVLERSPAVVDTVILVINGLEGVLAAVNRTPDEGFLAAVIRFPVDDVLLIGIVVGRRCHAVAALNSRSSGAALAVRVAVVSR